MMTTRKIQILYRIFFILALVMVTASCGTYVSQSGSTGGITAKLAWNADGKTSAKTVALAPAGITTVRIIVTATDITTIQKDFAAPSGTGKIDGVLAGTGRNLTAQGLDANGTVIFQGSAANLTVQAGQTTNAGNVTMTAVAAATYSITGNITSGGSALAEVAVNTSGGLATTDVSGNYTISGLPDGSYTVTPTKTGYNFTPASVAITVNGSNITGNSFTATSSVVSVSAAPTLVSSNTNGVAGNKVSGLKWDRSSISADGRYVVFKSVADNLVPGDTYQYGDLFYKDLTTGAIQRFYIKDANNFYSLSADGRYVAFETYRNDLVDQGFLGNTVTSGDLNNLSDVYVKDMVTGVIKLASSSAAGLAKGGGDSSLSSDGRYVAFTGSAAALGLGLSSNIFVKDLQSGALQIVDINAAGVRSNGLNSAPVISANGRYVVFISGVDTKQFGDTNKYDDVFRKDLQTGALEIVSTSVSGVQGNAGSGYDGAPQVSADGRYIVFESQASNLVANDTNGYADIFYKDMQTGAIQLVTVTSSGVQDKVACARPSISANGRYVAFYSQSKILAPNEDLRNSGISIFVKDMQTGELKMASSFLSDSDGFYQSVVGQITADGKYVLIETSGYTPLIGYHPEYGDVQILRVPNPFTPP